MYQVKSVCYVQTSSENKISCLRKEKKSSDMGDDEENSDMKAQLMKAK